MAAGWPAFPVFATQVDRFAMNFMRLCSKIGFLPISDQFLPPASFTLQRSARACLALRVRSDGLRIQPAAADRGGSGGQKNAIVS